MARYYLQNRYQDSGWEYIDGEDFEECGDAICRASMLSNDAICYGMVRVVRFDCNVVITFAAGVMHDGRKSFW